MSKSSFSGVNVVAKFFLSKDPSSSYRCISRTLGKLAIPESANEQLVQDQDIWLCKIVQETKPGKNFGVFILEPLEKIDPNNVKKLIPGFYYEPTAIGKSLIIKPKEESQSYYWMLSKDTRRAYSDRYHTLIVPCGVEPESNESESQENE